MAVKRVKSRIEIEFIGAHTNLEGLDYPDFFFLPGVGNYGVGAKKIRDNGLSKYINTLASNGVSVVGICLGMQLLGDGSEESPMEKGLGLIPGHVKRLDDEYARVPNVGWRPVNFKNGYDNLFPKDIRNFYFTHSFYFEPIDAKNVIATSDHGNIHFPAAIRRDNVFGFQFHLEKSGTDGLEILRCILDQ